MHFLAYRKSAWAAYSESISFRAYVKRKLPLEIDINICTYDLYPEFN
jgi:hypothetical protein